MLWCQQKSALVEKVDFISLRKRLNSTQRIMSKSCYHYCQRLQTAVAIWSHITTKWRFSSHGPRLTQDWLKTNCTDFIALDEWPPNSPDLNPLDYHVWGAMLQEAYHKLQPKPKTIPEIWTDLP